MASKSNKQKDDWMNTKWRPAMGWMYMVVCIFDFILFPILWAVVQFWETSELNDAFRQWQPLTLQGAGLFHMAMGAVLGITAYSRGKEKMVGVADNGPADVGVSAPAVSSVSAPAAFKPSYSAAPVATGSLGKAMPVQPEDEEL